MNPQDFRIDQLLNLYILLAKAAPVYSTPSVKNGVWWTKKGGEIAGRLFSWIENDEGLFMMFKVNDDFQTPTAKNYYIRVEGGLVNWDYTKQQLDAQRRATMNFYEKWFDDLDKAIDAKYKAIVDYTKKGLVITGVVVGAYIAWEVFFKPYLQAKAITEPLKDVVRELKK